MPASMPTPDAPAACRDPEAWLGRLVDNVPGAVYQYRLDSDGRQSIPFVSRGIEALYEMPAEDFRGRIAAGELLVLPDDLDPFRASVAASHERLEPWTFEYRIRGQRSGRVKWIEAHAVPRRLACGAVVWDGQLADATARREAQDALRDSEARSRLVTENATDLINRFSPDGVAQFSSAASRTLLGYECAEIVGRDFAHFVHPDDLGRTLDAFRLILADPARPRTLTHRLRHKDGSYVWTETTARGAVGPDGRVAEVVTVTRSIEERRRLEARVQQAQKMEAVGRLAGGVAHDFNNLLTVINGFCEMILHNVGTQDPARTAAQLREIRKAGERAATLTRQLLAFGRQQIQTRTRVAVNAVVADIEAMVRRLIGEDVEVETALAPDAGSIDADVGQIEQVLVNLVVNARDAMPDGGVLTVGTADVELGAADLPGDADLKPGRYVVLSVSDTGCGMDEATKAHIFEPFYTTKELGKGTGLGLATVYGIVKQSDGFIDVVSAGPGDHVPHPPAAGRGGEPRHGRQARAAASRPGDHSARRGRRRRPRRDGRDDPVARLPRGRVARRAGRAQSVPGVRRADPPPGDRRGDAADERPGVGRPGPRPAAGPEGAVRHRLHRRLGAAARRAGRGGGPAEQAAVPRDAGPQDSRGAQGIASPPAPPPPARRRTVIV